MFSVTWPAFFLPCQTRSHFPERLVTSPVDWPVSCTGELTVIGDSVSAAAFPPGNTPVAIETIAATASVFNKHASFNEYLLCCASSTQNHETLCTRYLALAICRIWSPSRVCPGRASPFQRAA